MPFEIFLRHGMWQIETFWEVWEYSQNICFVGNVPKTRILGHCLGLPKMVWERFGTCYGKPCFGNLSLNSMGLGHVWDMVGKVLGPSWSRIVTFYCSCRYVTVRPDMLYWST
jgi:hypothetical protein